MKFKLTEWQRFSSFLLNPFVNRVNRRIFIRIVKFCRSMYEVEISASSGSPLMMFFVVPQHSPGL
jgi:hypothetical protein